MALISRSALRRRIEACAKSSGLETGRRMSRKFLGGLHDEIDEATEQIIFRWLTERTGKAALLAHNEKWAGGRKRKPKLTTPTLI